MLLSRECNVEQTWALEEPVKHDKDSHPVGTDHDHDTLEFDPWSMVKKFDHDHWHPGISSMVNGQNGYLVLKFRTV